MTDTSSLTWIDHPEVDAPVVLAAFAGWNDAGDAATWALRHLRKRWHADPFAAIDPEGYFDFSSTRPLVELDDDGRRQIHWPSTEFSIARPSRDIVLLEGTEPQLRWKTFSAEVIDVARAMDASLVVTLGALLAEVPHSRPVTIYGSCDDAEVGARLQLTPSSYEGPTGIVGVLHDALRGAGIPSASLWAAVPGYVSGATSPKAALALLERVSELLSMAVPTTDLEIATAAYERQIDELLVEDDDNAEYIRLLEAQYDETNRPDEDIDLAGDEADALVEEVERFLHDHPE